MADTAAPATSGRSPVVARTLLHPPRPRAETVERPDLVARRLASPARLGVVVGPAGWGKSTLLAQCHEAEPLAAWLSLERVDNDPVVLWTSLIQAVRSVVVGFGKSYESRLLTSGASAVDNTVVSICNELAERKVALHVFVDDLHLIDNETCRRSFHSFVRGVPDGVRVTVASRVAAPIPLARLRAEGDLVEIGASDLALSASEAHQVLTNQDKRLDQAHFDLLISRTEGWPAGLQLARMALAQSEDANAFVERFRGTDRAVAEYLLDEVLGSISDADRDFLVDTSILARLTGDLCDEVTGLSHGAETLARLEEANAFVVSLDGDGQWYRYHHLFAELLAAELHRVRAEDEAELHQRAFAWLRRDGQIAEAIRHALAADAVEAAATLMSEHWIGLMSSGSNETALRLIESFPPEAVAGHQPFAVGAASVAAMAGDMRTARRWLHAAEQSTHDGARPDGMASTASSVALLRGSLAPAGVDAALADGRVAYGLEPAGSPWRPLAALIVGRSLVMKGKAAEATPFLREVAERGEANPRVYALAELSIGHLARSEYTQAKELADAACQLVCELGIDDLVMAGTAHAAAALAAIALGDERSARVELEVARRPMATVGRAMPLDALRARLLLAGIAITLGRYEIADRHLRETQPIVDSIDDLGVMRQEHTALCERLARVERASVQAPCVDFTERELEIIALLPAGLTLQQIGDELYLSRNTIKTYLRRIYGKLNASRREDAVLIAHELGLIRDGRSTVGTESSAG